MVDHETDTAAVGALDDRGPSQRDRPDPASLLAALEDGHCQGLLEALAAADEPLPVGALVERCEVAESTAYRKLARLQDVGLVAKHERLRSDGRCAGYYALRADGVTIGFGDGDVTATIHSGD